MVHKLKKKNLYAISQLNESNFITNTPLLIYIQRFFNCYLIYLSAIFSLYLYVK